MKPLSWVGALLALPLHAMAAAGYSALDITPPGMSACSPGAVNAQGQVAGHARLDSLGVQRGFVTGPGGVGARLIGTLGGSHSYVSGLNDRGQAVGQASVVGDAFQQAILVEDGATKPTPIGQPAASGYASAVSPKGRVVGGAQDPSDRLYHAFITRGGRLTPRQLDAGLTPTAVLSDGTMAVTVDQGTAMRAAITGPDASGLTLLGTLGGNNTFALGMNRSRVAVGFASNAGESRTQAFVTDPGGANLRALGLPGVYSLAQSINAQGKVVGFYTIDWTDGMHAYVAKVDGTWKALDSLVTLPSGVALQQAWSINDAGQISARGTDGRCYLLTPLP